MRKFIGLLIFLLSSFSFAGDLDLSAINKRSPSSMNIEILSSKKLGVKIDGMDVYGVNYKSISSIVYFVKDRQIIKIKDAIKLQDELIQKTLN